MEIWVNLEFGDGNFEHGFSNINLKVTVPTAQHNITQLEVQLPPDAEIPGFYERWKKQYYLLLNHSRGRFKDNQVTNLSKTDCYDSSVYLRNQLHQWLRSIQLKLEQVLPQDPQPEIRLVIHTEKIASLATKDILHRLPWQEWNFFAQKFSYEAAVCFQSSVASTIASKESLTAGKIRRARILSIFGDSTNIDTSADRELLEKLKKRAAELIVLTEPNRSDFKALWEEPCDILFFAGHSETKNDGQIGVININRNDSLSLGEIKNTLKTAINKGLKLAIFNSCDGLGLARQLASLNLPYIIVWREEVPDKLAQKFLQYFLNSFSQGESLFNSVRQARDKLQELADDQDIAKQLPGVSWLPIICQNTTLAPPSWEDLGGLSGELPDGPYQGLSAFRQENADFFFGREKFIASLVEAVNSNPLVPVIGASGSGKSSLVFAGLIPRLQESLNVEIVSFRPGKNPFDALAAALNPLCQSLVRQQQEDVGENARFSIEINLKEHLELDNTRLYYYINNIARFLGYQRLVLVADQFEELYTLATEAERQPFLDALLYVVKFGRRFTLVLTLRADFLRNSLDYQPFGEALQRYAPLLLTPMNSEELRDAIKKPAAKMKVELESGLTSRLINDLGNQLGRLPMLEFALTQLWSKQKNWYLTHEAYEEIGGLEKALANYADDVLNPLSGADKEKAQRVFIQLVRPGEGTEDTKRVATRHEVGQENWDLVKRLADARLVVTGWDEIEKIETVEIVHEALIREWGTLREWIESNREFRIWQERLKPDVQEWLELNKNRQAEALLQGTRLAVAQEWYEQRREQLTQSEQNFITASITRQQQVLSQNRRRQQVIMSGLTGGLVVTLILALLAWWQWQNARLNEIKATSVSSQALLISSQDFDALIESLKALKKLNKTPLFSAFYQPQEKAALQQKLNILLQEALYKVTERNQLERHTDEVTDVSFSPLGNTIATASKDKTVKLWSLDGKEIETLSGHQDLVQSVRFSPKDRIIATASWDGTVKLWTTEGQLMTTLTGHNTKVNSVSFSPDEKTIASADAKGYIKLWTIDGQLIKTFKGHEKSILNLSFSPNGHTLATASQDNTVKLWNRDGKELQSFTGDRGHKDWVWSVNFSPDGEKIATASRDGTVKLWSIEGREIKTLDAHKEATSVSFSPDGQKIVTVGSDQTIKIWNKSGSHLQTLRGHKDCIWSISFSPDSKIIATASKDGTAKLWQLKGKKHQIQQVHNGAIYSLSFSPDGSEYATASQDKTAKLWRRDGELIKTLKLDDSSNDTWFTHINFSPNGKIIATATADGNVILWNHLGEKIKAFKAHNQKWIWQVSFSPDGKTFATAGHDGLVKLWNLNGDRLQTLTVHTKDDDEDGEGVNSVSFSPDGKTIATAGWDKTVKLWTREGKLIKILNEHLDGVHSVSFSPLGNTIATASEDRTVKLWTTEGQFIRTIKGHNAGVFRVRFSPDGKTIATASKDKTVKLWSLDARELKTYFGHDDSVWSLNFSPDATHLASGDNTGKLILWNLGLESNQLLADGCHWVGDFLKNNPNVTQSDRRLCDGIGTP
ncbi:AAA family ATPase [Scytonema sp. UIC 10036]|uniref:nSTAND1 domain-containing NTPase n=1 Tax=Scytonema sp. UIC 10036 TaxID=2304196 RepID=UPI0012DA4DD6|nr:AAA family ATPase [Scytonema sp. UIC 10036]MUG92027.1 AAA family ATPase [Scytonema sp. UIC 10036]